MIPDNISKEHIFKAIEKIDIEGIPPKANSRYYDVLHEGKKYPPKLLISYANYFANGEFLNRTEFRGGLDTSCFQILENSGLQIIERENKMEEKKIWIEKTNVKGREDRLQGERAFGKVLWSPKKAKNGADIYKNMLGVNAGDIILHLVDNESIQGVSVVENSAKDAEGIEGTPWEGDSYVIKLNDYKKLIPPLHREEILTEDNKDKLYRYSGLSEVFYTKDLNLRQGAYLTPCTKELATLINQTYQNKFNKSIPYLQNLKQSKSITNKNFEFQDFSENLKLAGLYFRDKILLRFIGSLLTKPFTILTGLSGSGKTKLAQAFVHWICENEEQYCIVPVGADWTNREPLLGYPNALNNEEYVKPENGFLDLLIRAGNNETEPHFLILDEMNLSHVERYFADFLSIMETSSSITLFTDETRKNGVPSKIEWPSNLFIIGTVNIDETTYMFSPKVLDRANTIEFRIDEDEMQDFLKNHQKPDLSLLKAKGASMAQNFLMLTKEKSVTTYKDTNEILLKFFKELKKTGTEFGYRSASEIYILISQLEKINKGLKEDELIDIAIMQKMLPKLHGSRRKLCPTLINLAKLCINNSEIKIEKEIFEKLDFDFKKSKFVKYPLSLEKLSRMYNGAIENGFASYAEA